MTGVSTSRVYRRPVRALIAATTAAAAGLAWLLLGLGSAVADVFVPMRGVTVLVAGIALLLLLGSRPDRGRHRDGER